MIYTILTYTVILFVVLQLLFQQTLKNKTLQQKIDSYNAEKNKAEFDEFVLTNLANQGGFPLRITRPGLHGSTLHYKLYAVSSKRPYQVHLSGTSLCDGGSYPPLINQAQPGYTLLGSGKGLLVGYLNAKQEKQRSMLNDQITNQSENPAQQLANEVVVMQKTQLQNRHLSFIQRNPCATRLQRIEALARSMVGTAHEPTEFALEAFGLELDFDITQEPLEHCKAFDAIVLRCESCDWYCDADEVNANDGKCEECA